MHFRFYFLLGNPISLKIHNLNTCALQQQCKFFISLIAFLLVFFSFFFFCISTFHLTQTAKVNISVPHHSQEWTAIFVFHSLFLAKKRWNVKKAVTLATWSTVSRCTYEWFIVGKWEKTTAGSTAGRATTHTHIYISITMYMWVCIWMTINVYSYIWSKEAAATSEAATVFLPVSCGQSVAPVTPFARPKTIKKSALWQTSCKKCEENGVQSSCWANECAKCVQKRRWLLLAGNSHLQAICSSTSSHICMGVGVCVDWSACHDICPSSTLAT